MSETEDYNLNQEMIEPNTEDRCYICLDPEIPETSILVKPCINSICTAKVHINCLREQLHHNNTTCGVCKNDINMDQFETPVESHHSEEEERPNIKYYHVIIFIIVVSIIFFMIIFGITFFRWSNNILLNIILMVANVSTMIGLMFLKILLVSFILRYTTPCHTHINILEIFPKNKILFMSGMIIFIIIMIIGSFFLDCGVGYLVFKYIFGRNESFFTWKTLDSFCGPMGGAIILVYWITLAWPICCVSNKESDEIHQEYEEESFEQDSLTREINQ